MDLCLAGYRITIETPDRSLALLLLIGSVLIFLIGIFRQSPVALLIAFSLGIPGLVWRLSKGERLIGHPFRPSETYFLLLSALFYLLLAGSLLSVAFRGDPYQRPAVFFFLLVMMVGVTCLEGLTADRRWREYHVLFQIFLIGIVLAWSQMLLFSDVAGDDPWYHRAFTQAIIASSALPLDPLLRDYCSFPLFHLTVAGTALLGDLPYKEAAMYSADLLLVAVNVLMVYLICDRLFPDHPSIRLLAPLVTVISPLHIYMAWSSTPNGFAGLFILPIFLLLLFSRTSGTGRHLPLVLLFLGTIILSHTITALLVGILLFVAWGAGRVLMTPGPRERNFSILLPIGYMTALLAWWFHDMGSTMETFVDLFMNRFSMDSFDPYATTDLPDLNPLPPLQGFVQYLTNYAFLFLPLLGLLYMLSRRGDRRTCIFAVLAAIPILTLLFSYVAHVTVIEDRWMYFNALLGTAAAALSLLLYRPSLSPEESSWRSTMIRFLPVLLVCILALLSVTNQNASIDNRLLTPDAPLASTLTDAELAAAKTAATTYMIPIASDYYYSKSLRWDVRGIEPYSVEVYDRNLLQLKDHLVLVRVRTLFPPDFIYSYRYLPYYDLPAALDRADYSRVFDDGSVKGYLYSMPFENAITEAPVQLPPASAPLSHIDWEAEGVGLSSPALG